MVNLASPFATSGKQSYTGKPISQEECENYGLAPYLPSKELVNAVNLTIFFGETPSVTQGGARMR